MDELDDLLDGSLDIVDNPEGNLFSEEEFNSVLPSDPGKNADWNRRVNVGDSGLGDSQWDDGATIDEIQGGLNTRRAELQPWTDQLGNAITQAVVGEIVGGTIEGVGYLLDWEGMANLVSGDEKEFANWFSDIGKSIREGTQDATQIYEKTPGEMNLLDSGYWFKNSVSVASTLSMMLPSMAATKGLGMLGRGVSKIAGRAGRGVGKKLGREISKEAFDISKKMGIQAEWMTEGITQAVVSRHIENTMEASGTFEDIYNTRLTEINPKTNKLFTDEEARLSAAEGASENYKHGWAMLAQDMVQYLSIGKVFNPVTRQMEVARKLTTSLDVPQWAKKAGAIAGTFLSEAGEEGYQSYISSKAKLGTELRAGLISKEEYDNQLSEIMSSDETKTSMLFGGLGGSVFQAVGPKVNDAFKSKDKKEFEASASENFNTALGDRNKVLAALQIQKNQADVNGTEREIEMAQDEIILEMVLDGIDSDNLEMVMSAIKNGPEMTAEEQEQFQKDNGYEWNSELAKEGADRALKIAEEVKEIHYKNLNKAKNKNTDANIVKAMSRIEYENNKHSERITKSKQEQEKRIKDIKHDAIRKPTDRYMKRKDVQSKILATKEAIRRQTEALETAVDKESRALKSEIIKNHNYDLSQLEKEVKELSKPVKGGLTSDEKEGNRRAGKVYNEDTQFEIADGYLEQLELNDAITENTMQLTRLNDKEFQKALINKQTAQMINNTTDKALLEKFKSRVEKGDVTGYSKKSEKDTVLKQLGERIAALQKEEEEALATEASEEAEKELKTKTQSKNANIKTPANNVVVPVEEALEDEHREEEAWFEEEVQEKQEEALETKINNGKSIAFLDANNVTNKAYRDWIKDGSSKIGTKVRYEVDQKFIKYGTDRAKKAYRDFKTAQAKKSEIPQSVYDHFPVQVFIGDGNGIFSHLPEKPANTAPDIDKKRYEENYVTERKNIIDGLFRGEVVSSEIKHTSGGQLQTQVDENGVVAENSIKDLKQVKDSKKTPHIAYSNIDGELYDATRVGGKPVRSQGFEATEFSVKDEDGKPMPYRGGLFVLLRKADGTPFPVRLNFLKNTNEQAETLADILIDIAVPNEKKGKKKYNLSTPLSLTDPELQERIRTELKPEVEFLKGDPELKDIINMFVYVSQKTEGLTSQLYMSGINLYFGDKGNHIKPDNRVSKRQELVDFLRDTKRRQFNLNMWNNTKDYPGYRDFVMDNRIINTNVVIGAPEFDTETIEQYEAAGGQESGRQRRRVQIYAKPVDSKVPAKPVKVKKGEVVKTVVDTATVSPDSLITDDDAGLRMKINAELKKQFPGKFYVWDGKEITALGKPAPAIDKNVAMKVVNKITLENTKAPDMSGVTKPALYTVKDSIDWWKSLTAEQRKMPQFRQDERAKVAIAIEKQSPEPKPLSEFNDGDVVIHEDTGLEYEILDRSEKVGKVRLKRENNQYLFDADNEGSGFTLKSSKVDDTKISTPAKKDIPSSKVRKIRTRRKSVGDGSTNSAKPNNTKVQNDNAVKKEDDKKQPKCKK